MNIGIVYLVGAVHGLILGAVLGRKQANRLPNKLLALLMTVFSIDLAMAGFYSLHLERVYPFLIGLDYPLTFLYGPLLFLYVETLSSRKHRLGWRDLVHFLPFVALLCYMAPFFVESGVDKIRLVDQGGQGLGTYGFSIINHLKVAHGLTYVAVVVFRMDKFRGQDGGYSSTGEQRWNFVWLEKFIIGVILLAGTAGVIHLVSSFWGSPELMGMKANVYDNITLLSVMAFVYGVGYLGLHQPEVFSVVAGPVTEPNEGAERYAKSGLERDVASRIRKQLFAVMEQEKPYRNSELNLTDLAGMLEVSPHNLTETINRYIGKNFYDFVNSYRVAEVKRKLVDSSLSHMTILAVGMEAGFNSKSTFNSVFKKHVGCTPSQYRKKTTSCTTEST